MKKEIMEEWVKALRSGMYKQTSGTLKKGNGYCCLGVLCSITNSKNWIGKSALPESIMKKVGMHSCGGDINNATCLASLNDDGMSFNEIADIIEKNWDIL